MHQPKRLDLNKMTNAQLVTLVRRLYECIHVLEHKVKVRNALIRAHQRKPLRRLRKKPLTGRAPAWAVKAARAKK